MRNLFNLFGKSDADEIPKSPLGKSDADEIPKSSSLRRRLLAVLVIALAMFALEQRAVDAQADAAALRLTLADAVATSAALEMDVIRMGEENVLLENDLARVNDLLEDKRRELIAFYETGEPSEDSADEDSAEPSEESPDEDSNDPTILAVAGQFWSGTWRSILGAGTSDASASEDPVEEPVTKELEE